MAFSGLLAGQWFHPPIVTEDREESYSANMEPYVQTTGVVASIDEVH